MNIYKKWIIATLSLILLPLLTIAGFNFYIDPLWNFNHAHRYNQIQMSFNERQQKTNLITFGSHDYNALILGSSRVTYISQYDFSGLKAFNYALNNMLLSEYNHYINYAKQQVGHDFDCIVIGLDFFATNKNLELPSHFELPSYYFGQSQQLAYRYKTLLSTDVLKYARKNYEASHEGLPRSYAYNRANVKTLVAPNPEDRQWLINKNLKWYGEKIYGPTYQYDSVKPVLQALKKANPHTRFIIFTTPSSDLLFRVLIKQGRFGDYERWIRDCVEANGEVYNFMYPNSITSDLNNYYDASHFYPQIGTFIAHRVIGHEDKNIPQDFGVRVTARNLDQHLQEVARQVGVE
ncbi:MAG: hypothetical protein PHT79_11095 [Syntrophomonadaceae bacterium]|nr:hypothetical protein [Syntrophomonadaceae bacterium]MDD3890001.1 hypothetical protein [Syntrophomonadaceae bacterium]MDD4550290.1 hypothetical protein [Syntrophomonadaceae bacterium]